ncbi:MAG TPA: hypothetical protein GX519_00075 [Thermoanaerobacterales bacterium]|nr:hypothetical protein [Thermoanaerobacterales bacterium]
MLNISVPTVSRLIKRAVKDKLVEFVIRDPYIECIKLEEQIKQAFDLKDVIIAPSPHLKDENKVESTENRKKLVALEGARYIQRIITENDVLGISWGKTMYHLIHYLNPCQKVNAAFVTLHGSVSSIESELDVRTLVSRIAMTFGGKNYSLLMEGLMSNAEIVNSIKQEKNVKRVFEIFDRITISVCGIGSFYPQVESALSKSEYLCGSELAKLKNKNVAADLALRFIDLDGNECDTDLKDRTLSIDLDKFKKIKTKITVAAGQSKAHAVLAALKGKLVDVLITDYTLGKKLLKG